MKIQKKSLISGLALIVLGFCVCLDAASTSKPSQSPAYNLHGEADDTDIYAVPLDDDEESEEEEMQMLEREGREAEARWKKK